MLYVDNLQHGFQTSPFFIPRCSFLDSKMIEAIINEDRRGDVASDNVKFGHLRVGFLQSHFFVQMLQLLVQLCICNLLFC
jgi:hypothetical protein